MHIVKDGEGRIYNASVNTTKLEDLSPFRGFPALRELAAFSLDGTGKVGDISWPRGNVADRSGPSREPNHRHFALARHALDVPLAGRQSPPARSFTPPEDGIADH